MNVLLFFVLDGQATKYLLQKNLVYLRTFLFSINVIAYSYTNVTNYGAPCGLEFTSSPYRLSITPTLPGGCRKRRLRDNRRGWAAAPPVERFYHRTAIPNPMHAQRGHYGP